ncbi:glycosyltransferase family 2 protein [Paraburkholderia pallida]|uniref:Glycosyltransferase family 2 protein n=1 Tax=Paraburkholderia pallida TaxID=2547399 RepID=A0A4P7CUI8_9BURK|nr:glycosyltransferase family 2 protein [Paraburkholderia pallida]QBQ98386.1 glycosyltransferase family 2 protein [Paraburkholderia pallida]
MKDITVVIGNYNYARFLREAIDSALANVPASAGSGERVRVLVIDDGSTDDSRAIIESYGDRVTPVFKENQGQSSVYNLGLSLVQTEYVLFLDSDDILYPEAIGEVLRAFESGDYAKVQFRLDVIGEDGMRTGVRVPNSTPPSDCAALLRRGWLYPSPPASGNAYRVSALRSVFPIPMSLHHRKAADFFAIYGIALTGAICALDNALGGYRVHRKAEDKRGHSVGHAGLSLGNCEDVSEVERSFPWRWQTLRHMIRTRLGEDLPEHFIDFSFEKNRLCVRLYDAPTTERWHWLIFESHRYFTSLVRNPYWSLGKKLGVLGLTLLCLIPNRQANNFALRYISNPAARFAAHGSAAARG